MKTDENRKIVGSDVIFVKVRKCLNNGVTCLTNFFIKILKTKKIPDECRNNIIVSIYGNIDHIQNCSYYHGVKLISLAMKLLGEGD